MAVVYTDGACSGNPGPMGIGIFILIGKKEFKISESIGEGTNNISEYSAVIRALELLKEKGQESALINSDSQLLVKQLKGEYKIKKPHLKELKEKIDILSNEMKIQYRWIPREKNQIADKLSKEAIGL